VEKLLTQARREIATLKEGRNKLIDGTARLAAERDHWKEKVEKLQRCTSCNDAVFLKPRVCMLCASRR